MLDLRNISLIILLQVYEGLAHLSCSLSYAGLTKGLHRPTQVYTGLHRSTQVYACLFIVLRRPYERSTQVLRKVYAGLKINLLRRLNDER